MTASTRGSVAVSFVPDEAMVRLIRERDSLFVLHEALTELEFAHVVFRTGHPQNESARGFLQSTGRPTVSNPFLLDELAAVLLAS
jgi:hypothetical protein